MAKKYLLGVDVGTGSIKAMAGMVSEAGNIVILGSGTAPAAGIHKGAWVKIGELAAAIKEAVDSAAQAAKIPANNIYLGISGPAVSSANSIGSVQSFAVGAITAEDVQRAYKAAAGSVAAGKRVLHVLPGAFFLDGEEMEGEPVGQSGTLLAAETHVVTVSDTEAGELTTALAAKGIHTLGIFANSIVCAESLADTADEEDFLVMDVGAGVSDLVLYSRGKIVLSASLPLGGDYITGDIALGVGVTGPHAEEIKHYYARLNKNLLRQEVILDCNDYGTTDKHVAYDHLHNIVESRVEEIVAILFDYIEPHLSSYSIRKILLTGGSALLPSIRESVNKAFAAPAQLAKPDRLPPEYAHPANSSCYGILCHAAKDSSAKQPEGAWRSFIRKMKDFI